jgi:hypothetical protein
VTEQLAVADIAHMLGQRVDSLVPELLPAARREGHEWKVGSVAGEEGRSLSIHRTGQRAGVWADFSSDDRGDALDLVAAVLYAGDTRAAIAWSRRWLGLTDASAPAATRPSPRAADDSNGGEEEAQRHRLAMRIFLEAAPSLTGTAAAAYLAGRGIDLAQLGRQPRALRFHGDLFNRESGRRWPAMVAAVCNAAGEHVATHRTWLAHRDGRWTKAPLRDAKMSIGAVRGGSIRLWRGASARALKDARDGDVVAIAEGIETALSVAIACPELRVLASVSLANMGAIELPPAVACVILCADSDPGNDKAAAALARAIDHYQAEGREVRVAMPDVPGADWNDILQGVEG